MSPDTAIMAMMSVVAAVVVIYIVWSNQHDKEKWERKQDQRDLLLDIQRELDRQQSAVLARCTELQRHLNDHRRILKYLSRRLS